jgi:predicted MFS family arabinose efflux permease
VVRGGLAPVILSAVAFGLTYADHAPLIPLLAADLGISDVQSGLLSSSLFAAYFATTLLGTGAIDRLGPRRAVGAGLVLACGGTAVMAIAPVYAVALLGKAAQGAGSALAFVSATRYIVGLYGDRRSHFALGLYGAGFPLGSATALALMPALASTLGAWRSAFAAEALLIGLVALAWTRSPAVPYVAPRGDMRDALRCGNCWAMSLQHAAGFGLALASGTWITVFLLREFALPLSLSGVLGSVLLFLAVLARSSGGWLLAREHVPTKVVMRAGDTAIIAGVALLAVPQRPLPVALLGMVLVGIGVGLPYAAVFNTASASLPAAPAAAQGLAALGGTAGAMVGAPLMGYAVQTYGFGAAWAVVGTVALTALAMTVRVRGEEELA